MNNKQKLNDREKQVHSLPEEADLQDARTKAFLAIKKVKQALSRKKL